LTADRKNKCTVDPPELVWPAASTTLEGRLSNAQVTGPDEWPEMDQLAGARGETWE